MTEPSQSNQAEKQQSTEQTQAVSPAQGTGKFASWRAKASPLIDRVFESIAPEDDEKELFSWEQDADRAYIEQNPARSRSIFYTLCVIFVVLLIWSMFAEIDQVTKGQGKVIPSQQVQILQSLDGGVITEINVKEGDIVDKDQLLVKLDATRFASSLQESRAELLALQAKAIRLRAVAEGTDFIPSEDLKNEYPDIVAQEKLIFESSKAQLNALNNIAQQQISQRKQELVEATAHRDQASKSHKLISRELEVTRPLVTSGAVSEVELLRLERQIVDLAGERDQAQAQINRLAAAIKEAKQKALETELNFKNNIREDLSITMSRLSVLEGSNVGLTDRVNQTAIRSPVRGTIKRLFFNTIGGVVLPGKEVVEIIPLDDTLLLEAKIKPQDIAFLYPGQKANVKFTAYDFVVYGGLDGQVEHIGADTVTDEEGNPFYIVRVRTSAADLGEGRPIIPGMIASVDILTGKKTILEYIMKPLLRAKQYALTER